MGKSCKEVARSLLECMKKTTCMRNGGDLRSCLREDNAGSADVEDCQELRTAYFACKRSGLDMRSRIRGPRVY